MIVFEVRFLIGFCLILIPYKVTLESFEKIDAENQLVVIGEKLEETSIKDLSSFSFDPSMLIPKFESCSDLKKDSSDDDGLYTLWSNDQQKFIPTLCKFDSTGSYAVIQSRVRSKEDFNFLAMKIGGYEDGFGNSENEFWLGLNRINEITESKPTLKVILSNEKISQEHMYKGFFVSNKRDGYRLNYDNYLNDGQDDPLSLSKSAAFYDRRMRSMEDNHSLNCALSGSWWFHCTWTEGDNGMFYKHVQSNLNGAFTDETNPEFIMGNRWSSWLYSEKEFTKTQMLLLN